MFGVLLNTACSMARLSFFPRSTYEGNRLGMSKRLRQLAWTGQRSFPYHITSCSAIKLRQRKKGVRGRHLVSKVGAALSGWAWVCWWEVVSDCSCITFFPFTFFFFFKSFPHLLNCHYLDPQVFSLLFLISPPSCGEAGGRAEWSSGCVGLWLLAKANPQQTFTSEKWGFTIQIEIKTQPNPP